jgi:hypothetical protein
MNTPEILNVVEEKMNDALMAYTKRNWTESELKECLIEDLRKATSEFLEVRSKLIRGTRC